MLSSTAIARNRCWLKIPTDQREDQRFGNVQRGRCVDRIVQRAPADPAIRPHRVSPCRQQRVHHVHLAAAAGHAQPGGRRWLGGPAIATDLNVIRVWKPLPNGLRVQAARP